MTVDSIVLLEDKHKDPSIAEQRAEIPVDSTVLLEDKDLSTVKQRAETHVNERSLASCVPARFPDTVTGAHIVWKA